VSGTTAEGTPASWRARRVVGADGAKGVIGPSVGLRLQKRFGIAREIELPFAGGADDGRWHPKLTPGAAYLDYGSVPNGYAWIFPKRNCLSVGAGLLVPKEPGEGERRGIGEMLRAAIDNLLESVGLPPIPEGSPDAPRLWAHPIPFWTGAEPLQTPDGRVLLVGDASGVVQPLFGEGIQYALRTGDLAARCLASAKRPPTPIRYGTSSRASSTPPPGWPRVPSRPVSVVPAGSEEPARHAPGRPDHGRRGIVRGHGAAHLRAAAQPARPGAGSRNAARAARRLALSLAAAQP
jgi:flavin-dependent dehydrogenase